MAYALRFRHAGHAEALYYNEAISIQGRFQNEIYDGWTEE